MIRRPPISTRTETLFPYTTLFRSLRRDFNHPVRRVRARVITTCTDAQSGNEDAPAERGQNDEKNAERRGLPELQLHDAPFDFYGPAARSEEHTSELQSLMRISYAVFCLKKKTHH